MGTKYVEYENPFNDVRLNLMISSELRGRLKKKAKQENTTISEYVRSLIYKDMEDFAESEESKGHASV